jgi:hypothetical protein
MCLMGDMLSKCYALHITTYDKCSKAHLMHKINIVSEWLLFNANSAIFQLYHGENKLIFNEMRSDLL